MSNKEIYGLVEYLKLQGWENTDKVQKYINDLKEENKKLKRQNKLLDGQVEYLRSGEYLKQVLFERDMLQDLIDEGKLSIEVYDIKKITKRNSELLEEKENLIKYLEDKINIYYGFIDTVKSDLEELKYALFAFNNMKERLKENKLVIDIYKDILERVKSGKYE